MKVSYKKIMVYQHIGKLQLFGLDDFYVYFFFPIANLKKISWCKVIQQIKKSGIIYFCNRRSGKKN